MRVSRARHCPSPPHKEVVLHTHVWGRVRQYRQVSTGCGNRSAGVCVNA